MAERFQKDVWPVMARHLEIVLLQQQKEPAIENKDDILSTISPVLMRHEKSNAEDSFLNANGASDLLPKKATLPSRIFHVGDSEHRLLLSILRCLGRVLRQEECSRALKSILASLGSTLLPLLDIENDFEIEGLTRDCLKSILRIDCDILWRPLLELSGNGIPLCPININQGSKTRRDASIQDGGEKSILASRCHELLTFVDSLPEQTLF
jgi:hypothetical protein